MHLKKFRMKESSILVFQNLKESSSFMKELEIFLDFSKLLFHFIQKMKNCGDI